MWQLENHIPISQALQLENLKAHYGFSLNFIEVTVPLTVNEMIDIFGNKCKEYSRQCAICKAWDDWHLNTYKVKVIVSRDSIVKAAKND